MLDADDVLELAPGISVANGHVRDAVRGTSWPLNDTARWVLGRSGRTLGQVASELSAVHKVPAARARDDVLSFAWELNTALLANVVTTRPRWKRWLVWLRLAVRLAPAGVLPPPRIRRASLDTSSLTRAAISAGWALVGRVALIALVAAGVVVQLAVVMGLMVVTTAVAVGLGVGLGLYLHEAGHALALRGVAAVLVLAGVRTFVLHAPVGARRRSWVGASGPLLAAGVGLAVVEIAAAIDAIELVYMGLPLCGHTLAITVLNPDGRTACGL